MVDHLANLSDAVIAADDGWRVAYLNAAAARLWSRTPEELLGRPLFELLSGGAENAFAPACAAAGSAGEPIAFSAYSDAVGAWLELRGSPEPAGYALLLRDVSELRDQHRAALSERHEREVANAINQRLFETSVDLILIVDRRGNFIRVSPSSFTILGYRPEEMVGHSAVEFLYPEDLDSTRNEMRMARRGRQTRNFDCRYVHKNGRIVPLGWTGVWSEPEQQHFFIGRDMTERIAAEEMRQAQRMEAVGQLTGGIAHDFNNILTVVIGNLDMLRHGLPGTRSDLRLMGDRALRGAQRAAELTGRLLAFGRRQMLAPEPVALNELLASEAAALSRLLGGGISVNRILGADLWECYVDADQLETAILNLASNARDAMPLGGRLTLETANRHFDSADSARLAGIEPGEYVMLAVSDTGCGIAKADLARVFEPFFTTKEVGKGSGLGLAQVYGFVKQSRGHVTIYSEVGVGTTVRLYLQRHKAQAVAEPMPPGPVEALRSRGKELILVVEDDAPVRQYSAQTLRGLGYRVLEAEDAAAALRVIDDEPAIDLMFTDVGLPGMNGRELADESARRRPAMGVLFTTGYAGKALTADGTLRRGANILQKPFTREELAAKVRSSLDRAAVT